MESRRLKLLYLGEKMMLSLVSSLRANSDDIAVVVYAAHEAYRHNASVLSTKLHEGTVRMTMPSTQVTCCIYCWSNCRSSSRTYSYNSSSGCSGHESGARLSQASPLHPGSASISSHSGPAPPPSPKRRQLPSPSPKRRQLQIY